MSHGNSQSQSSAEEPKVSAGRALRIALDARYLRERPSGIGTYVQALVERLPGVSPADQFVFWAHRLAARPLSVAPNACEFVVRPNANSPRTIWWPRLFASFAKIDVFHCPQNFLPQGIPCASVVTLHDVMSIERPELYMQGLESFFTSGYYRRGVWRALRRATRLIAVSQATADRALALVPEAAPRLRVIHEAVEADFRLAPNEETARARAARLVGGDAPFLLLVGANAATKRHALALEAFAAAVPEPWRLVLLQRLHRGKGLATLASRLRIAHRLVWLEGLSRAEVITLLQSAGALLQPSLYEGFALPVLEAMACGCPVVASDIPALREVTAGVAQFFPADDARALAGALSEITGSEELRESLGRAGIARAWDFSWDRATRETLEVYHEAAAVGA